MKKQNNSEFYDSKGMLRQNGESFYDSKGMLRQAGEEFYDAKGILRQPGEEFYDSKGMLRQPGDEYYDEQGALRSGGVETKEENIQSSKPVFTPSSTTTRKDAVAPMEKSITTGKIIIRIFLLIIFLGGAFTSVWEEVVTPLNGNIVTWFIIPIIITSIISSLLCLILYKIYHHIFGYFVRTLTSIIPSALYFLVITKFSSDSNILAGVIIFTMAISLITAFLPPLSIKLYQKIKRPWK